MRALRTSERASEKRDTHQPDAKAAEDELREEDKEVLALLAHRLAKEEGPHDDCSPVVQERLSR